MRMEEEGLSEEQAVRAVLRDNLFMLDIDPALLPDRGVQPVAGGLEAHRLPARPACAQHRLLGHRRRGAVGRLAAAGRR